MPKFNTSHFQNLIAQGETKAAIKQLLAMRSRLHPPSIQSEVTHLSARWNDYERTARMGTTAQAQLDLSKRQMDQSLLQLLERIEEVGAPPKTLLKTPSFWIGLATVAAILIGVVALFGLNMKELIFPANEAVTQLDVTVDKVAQVDTTELPKIEPIQSEETSKKVIPSSPPPPKNTNIDTKPVPAKTATKKVSSSNAEPLKIKARSNKGNTNLRFQAGETVAFYYEVNKACYVRFIGKLVDGRTVLLFEDQKIGAAETNQSITLAEFTVEPPLGKEQLYFFAQNKAFPTLDTYTSEDGYIVITEGLPKALAKTRGFKVKNAFSEDRLDVLTYE